MSRVRPIDEDCANVSPNVAHEANSVAQAACNDMANNADNEAQVASNSVTTEPRRGYLEKDFDEFWNQIVSGVGLEPIDGDIETQGGADDDLGEHAPVRARKQPPTPTWQEVEDHALITTLTGHGVGRV